MAQNLIDLRRRIRAVKDTQKTTKAMKTVSAAKLRRSVSELNRTRPMMEKIKSLLSQVGKASNISKELENHPLLKERGEGETLIVSISADKGLCGAFNSHAIELTERHYKEKLDEEGKPLLVTIGNKVSRHFKKRDYPLKKSYLSIMSKLQYHHAMDISRYLQEIFLAEPEIKRIEFIFTEYISASRQEITIRQLFPIPLAWQKEDESIKSVEKDIEYIFEPSAEEIFKALLPKYINSLVYQVLLQSSASEYAARMVAMELATQSANDMIRSLTLTLNKVRQATITKELLEIITATEALNK